LYRDVEIHKARPGRPQRQVERLPARAHPVREKPTRRWRRNAPGRAQGELLQERGPCCTRTEVVTRRGL